MSRPILQPIKINLSELPETGRSYVYSRQSAELNPALKDLLGQRPYTVQAFIKPLGNAFEITGEIKTALEMSCSRCADDIEFPMNQSFQELLLVEEDRGRTGKSSKSQSSDQWQGDGIFCNHIQSPNFDIAEYIHEMIASNLPFRALRGPECDTDQCPSYQAAVAKGLLIPAEASPSEKKTSPFAVLEKLKTRPTR